MDAADECFASVPSNAENAVTSIDNKLIYHLMTAIFS